VAVECREGKGVAMHVFDDHFFPEVLDPQTGLPVPDGELGELAVTTLTKEASPVLRFRTGDMTRFVPAPCACGRAHRRIQRICGRVDDMLVIRGVNVYPSTVEATLLADAAFAGHYALVVDRRGVMPELEIHAELAVDAGQPSREDAARRLVARLEEHLRLRVDVVLADPGTLPRSETGKAKRVFERTAEADQLREHMRR